MGLTGALLSLYMVLLVLGAVISPDVGMSGHLITLLPQSVMDFLHMPAYGLLTWFLTKGLRERDWPHHFALLAGGSAALVFGVWMEAVQAFVPGRVVDIDDVWSNAIGIGMAAILMGWRPVSVHAREGFIRPLPLIQLK